MGWHVSWHPRDQKVFDLPVAINNAPILVSDADLFIYPPSPDFTIQASAYSNKKNNHVKIIKGLGINGSGVTMNTDHAIDTSLSYLVFDLPAMTGKYEVQVKCLPDFDTELSKNIR